MCGVAVCGVTVCVRCTVCTETVCIPAVELGLLQGDVGIRVNLALLLHISLSFLEREHTHTLRQMGFTECVL